MRSRLPGAPELRAAAGSGSFGSSVVRTRSAPGAPGIRGAGRLGSFVSSVVRTRWTSGAPGFAVPAGFGFVWHRGAVLIEGMVRVHQQDETADELALGVRVRLVWRGCDTDARAAGLAWAAGPPGVVTSRRAAAAVFPLALRTLSRASGRLGASLDHADFLAGRPQTAGEEGAGRFRLGVTIYSSIGIIATCGSGASAVNQISTACSAFVQAVHATVGIRGPAGADSWSLGA
jgi:hypothetical protein